MIEDQHPVAVQTSASGPATAAAIKAGRPGERPGPKRVRDENGNLVQPTPYYVQASCELSEDYFLTDDVLIGAGDKVMPFSVADTFSGAAWVEALVLSSGKLSHLYPDPAAVSGWSFTPVTTPYDLVLDAAVVGGGFGAQLMVIGPPSLATPAAWLTRTGPGTWSVGAEGTVSFSIERLSAGVSQYGPYFYGWAYGQAGEDDQFSLILYGARKTGSDTTGTKMLTLQWPTKMGLTIENTVVLFDPDQVPDGTATGFAVVRTSDGQISTYNQAGPASFSGQAASALPTAAAALLWAYSTPGSTTGQPAILWQNDNGVAGFQEETGAITGTDFTYGNPAGDGQVAAWRLNGAYTFTFLDNGLAQVVSEIPGTGAGISWTAPIPLVGGFEKIYSLPADPTQATLFAVDVDQTLNVLTKDPAAGWTQNVVHQDAAGLQPVTSWQTLISVLDANNNAVAGGKVQMAADRPVGLWQAGGSTILTPASPVTMTADGSGRIIASIPAQELDTAVLTAQALDSTGTPTGQPFTITPNTDVQNFLAGTHSLTDIGKLTSDALTTAAIPVDPASPDGPQTAVFPNLTSDGAGPVVQAINHVATLGLQPKVAGAVRSAMFDLTTTPPTFQTSPSPAGFDSLRGQLGAIDWWDSAKNDVESAFHGLRHGVLKFKRMVSSWEADTEQWVVNLTVDIGNGIDNVMTYVIADVKTAIHAISSFFHALGADITTAWEWLKHNVLPLLKETAANAAVISGLLTEGITQFTNVLSTLEKATDTFFTDEEANVATEIQKLANDLGVATPGGAAPPPAPTSDTGANITDDLIKTGTDVAKILQKSPGWWLYNKIVPYLSPGAPGPAINAATAAAVDTLLTDLVGDLTDSIDLVEAIYNTLDAAVTDTIHASGDLSQAHLADLVGDVGQIIHDALVLCDKLADTGLDAMKAALAGFDDILTTPLVTTVPLLSEILRFADIDMNVTVGQILSMLVAFPATLISKVALKTGLFPDTPPAAGDLGDDTANKWGTALSLLSGVTQLIWAFVDQYEDTQSGVTPKGGGEAPSAPAWTNCFDFFCPYILAITGWPSAPLSTTQSAAPFGSFPEPPGTNRTKLLPYIVAVSILEPTAVAFAYSWKTGAKTEDQNSTFNTYLQPVVLIASGIAALVLNHIYLYANNGSSNDKCELVLGNLSNICAWLGLQVLIDGSDGVSLALKIIIDAVANFGTAVCMFNDMCTASGI